MTATAGTTASQTLTVRCVGTAAFRFYWTRTVQRPAVAAPDTSMHATSEAVVQSAAEEPISEQSGFYMYSTTGSIMPGEERTFEFMWKPTQQNMATELWQMYTSPPCVPGFEPPQVRFLGAFVLCGVGLVADCMPSVFPFSFRLPTGEVQLCKVPFKAADWERYKHSRSGGCVR